MMGQSETGPSVLITEEGQVITIEMPNLIVSIRQKLPT